MHCPVVEHAQQVIQTSDELRQQFQALRDTLDACQTCKAHHSCPIWQDINLDIQAAIEAVLIEWGWLP